LDLAPEIKEKEEVEMTAKKILNISAVAVLVLATGCISSEDPNRSAKQGAAIGAAAGAVAGGVIGNQSGKTTTGAVIGAAAGAGIGAVVGHRRDKMAAEMREIENVEVQPSATDPEQLNLIVNDRVLFDTDSASLHPASLGTLRDIAEVLGRYPDATLITVGYTDSTGSEMHNQELSERRAQAVRNHLISSGVVDSRVTAVGLGESDPIASNLSEDGRQQNRRVEFRVHVAS
jgi:outer membrane protein OmpA-like peptidoglycan-associated protein